MPVHRGVAEVGARPVRRCSPPLRETEFLHEEPGEVRTNLEEQASFLTKKLSSAVDLYILAEVEGRVVGVADKPILELLGLTPDTELELSTDGERLIITPDPNARGPESGACSRAEPGSS